jgi:tetratricopeptide (TPR) repeat protein
MNQNRIGLYVGRATARSMAGDDDGALADYTGVIQRFEQKEADRRKEGKPAREATAFDLQSPMVKGPESASNNKKGETTRTEAVVAMRTNPGRPMTPEQMEYLPNVAGAYMNRGLIYSKRGDSEAALADLNKAVEINPHDFVSYYSRGKVLQKRGDLSASLKDLNKSIELNPSMAAAYLERGITLVLLGKDAEAQKDLQQAVKMEPRMQGTVESRLAEAKKEAGKESP